VIFCATGWCSCRGGDSRTVRKKDGEREREPNEREREAVLSQVFIHPRVRGCGRQALFLVDPE